jgi:hypothetical protein
MCKSTTSAGTPDTIPLSWLNIYFPFSRPHYGTELRIEVVDGATDKPVGVTLLTTQSLLQEQRDFLVEQGDMSLFQFLKGPVKFKGKRRMILELRTGLKTGFGSDFFEASKGSSTSGPGPGKYDHFYGLI